MTYRKVFLLFLSLLLVGCNLPQDLTAPQAWIDAPLDGSTLPLAPYNIVFHAFAQGNPAAVELTINGQQVSLDPVSFDQPLVTIHYQWSPMQPGSYIITAHTQDRKGVWSSAHTHTVMIGSASPTSTPALTLTPTPSLTLTPTPTLTSTATFTVTATPTAAELVFINTTQPNRVYRGSCLPNQLTFEVTTNPTNEINGMVVFTRLQDTNSSKNSGWDTGTVLNPQGNGVFRRSINTSLLNGVGQFKSAQLSYQFVATTVDNTILGRSQVYSDVLVTQCGLRGISVPVASTPTPTP
jgi:hypothetical protein